MTPDDRKRLRDGRSLNLVGVVFGRLTVLERVGLDKHYGVRWRCQCSCGSEHFATTNTLRQGRVTSCGCWQREHAKHRDTARHGHSRRSGRSRTYKSWRNMLHRCENERDSHYARYGGRGITVCSSWHVFENFLADMGECPPGLTIERINNDGNYEPGNCRWATWEEQAQNKSRRTSCKRGHPYPQDVRVDSKGARVCRICVAASARERRRGDAV